MTPDTEKLSQAIHGRVGEFFESYAMVGFVHGSKEPVAITHIGGNEMGKSRLELIVAYAVVISDLARKPEEGQ